MLLFISICMAGCEKVIEPGELPEQEPRIVVNGIIENNRNIDLSVSSSKSIISGKDYKKITDASVYLYEDDVLKAQLFHAATGNYTTSLFPQPGRNYMVKITAPGYEGVEASAILGHVPAIPYKERYDSVMSSLGVYSYGMGPALSGSVRFKLHIKDDPDKKDHYMVRPLVIIYDSSGSMLDFEYTPAIYNNENNSGGFSENNYDYFGTTIIKSDELLVNGSEVPLDFTISIHSENTPEIPFVRYAEVSVFVSRISEDLFKYIRTVNQQASTGVSLFAEPVLVHSNIKNGMGIFGAVSNTLTHLQTINIKQN